ncbi:hypothetical protein ISG33_01950 [Glaciecola sp. MH2013]|uniref:hypothetical protein n=1 Tax=Glaciecola sp. MH2013 TaxID=2785524 RepID=UPI00189E9B70|nr:hypothetical protein [Glaciecola sp. MH2013]MBF7072164.1 hypothetical protein [Glaciecola sp. MH2013]
MISSIVNYFVVIKPVYNTDNFKLPDVSTIVVGASHSATAIDTAALKQITNLAKSGEPLFFSYYKSKMLLTNNEDIDHLVVAISPIHIGKYADEHIFSNSSGSRKFVMDYFFLIDETNDPFINKYSLDYVIGISKFKLGVPFSYMSDLKVTLNYYTSQFTHSDYAFWGGVESLDGNHIEESRQLEKSNFYYVGENSSIRSSKIGVESIRRLFSLSEEYDVKVTVITTPMHPYFRSLTPPNIKKEFVGLIDNLVLQYPNSSYYDFSSFELDNDDYLDGDHLNKQGAAKFTGYLRTLGLLDSDG